MKSFLCHDEKLDTFIAKSKEFDRILNYDVCKELKLIEENATPVIENIKDTNLKHVLLNLSSSLPCDSTLKVNTERYVLSFPDSFPSCFMPVRTALTDKIGLYQSIRLYRGIISSGNYLLCDICHPDSLKSFNKSVKKFGHNVAASIRSAKISEVVCFPRLPHLYLSNSVYDDRVSDTTKFVEVDLHDFDNYLMQVELLAKAYVNRISSIAQNTCFKNIERYYGSIYTHAITWHLSTKELQIKFRTDSSFWPSVFEKSITRLKGNESYGICCGLLATHDIAEAFLTFIDNKMYGSIKDRFPTAEFRYTRRMDTFCFQSASIRSGDFTEIFEDVLEEFHLLPSKKDLILKNFMEPGFKLYQYLQKLDFKQEYLQGKFDQDLICLLMFKKLRDTGYIRHLEEFKLCLLYCAEMMPFLVEYLINDFQAIVEPERVLKKAILNLANFIIENCRELSKRSIQHLSILWVKTACGINSTYLSDYVTNCALSIFLYKLMEHLKSEPITKINSKYIEFDDSSPLFSSQLSLDVFSSMSLHRLVKILVTHKDDTDLDEAIAFAKYVQAAVLCAVSIEMVGLSESVGYDLVFIRTLEGGWDSKDCNGRIANISDMPERLKNLRQLKYTRPFNCTFCEDLLKLDHAKLQGTIKQHFLKGCDPFLESA